MLVNRLNISNSSTSTKNQLKFIKTKNYKNLLISMWVTKRFIIQSLIITNSLSKCTGVQSRIILQHLSRKAKHIFFCNLQGC